MDFSVRFTEDGKETLHELHIEIQSKIKKTLKDLSKNVGLGKPLLGSLSGFYSLIVGNYRAIYTLKDGIIWVHCVGHRKNVYDEFGRFLNPKKLP